MTYALRDNYGRKYPVSSRVQIGNDPSNQIVLLDPQVIPYHAVLWVQNEALLLEDHSGGSATFVNSAPVQGTVPLHVGDRVTIGSTLFTVDDLAHPQPSSTVAKRHISCMGWLLIGVALFAVEFILLGGAGYYLYNTDVEIQGGVSDLSQYLSTSQDPSQVSSMGMPEGNQPGPQILSLSDQWLGVNFKENFTQLQEMAGESKTLNGEAIKTIFTTDYVQQAAPQWMSYQLVKETENGKVTQQIETGIMGGVSYIGMDTCLTQPDPDPENHRSDHTPRGIFQTVPDGHVRLVEPNVTINGVVTDRYELMQDNFKSSQDVVKFRSGSLNRARDGGYLVHLEYVVVIAPQSWAINVGDLYSTTETTQVTFRFDRTYAADGTLVPKVANICAGQIK
jgi:hypothetical protein